MIDIKMLTDIKENESTLFLNLTLRQLVVVIIAGLVAFLIGKILNPVLHEDLVKFVIFVVCGLPAFLIGFLKVDGVPFSKLFKSVLHTTILAPQKRTYETETFLEEVQNNYDKEVKKKKKRKNKYKASKEAIK